jgi:ABC-2 type transport system ATP-binding protein
MSILVQNLSKIYGNQKAIDSINFEIEKGQVVGFLGPNGAGKSTTMKILTCFIPQTSGKAFVNGLDIEENSIEVRRQLGYLPEHNPLYLDMYVKEYLSFVADVFKVKQKKKRIAECIEITGLTLEHRKKIGQLSKGYRQRVGLAQALIHDPSVLILDEPTSGLDPNQVVEIRQLIKNLGKEKTVLLSTHQLTEVEAICDRAIIINHGAIVADKPTNELKSGLDKQTTIDVIFGNSIRKALIEKLPGIRSVSGEGVEFTLTAEINSKIQEALFSLAVKEGNNILSMNQRQTSLEEVFKTLTTE